jgi:hypothetical protein
LLPRVELDYRVAPGLDCPSAEDVRAEIAKEMGGDPSSVPGPVTGLFHVVVSPQGTEGIEIAVKFEDVIGKRSFTTSFKGSPRSSQTCAHLVRTHVAGEIALEVTVQMSRRFRARLAGASACASSGPTPSACNVTRFDLWPEDWTRHLPKPRPEPPPLPERWPVAIRVGIAAGPELVASNWGSVGVSADVGVRYRAFSAGVEVHGDPPLGSIVYPSVGAVSFARLSGALLLCGHFGLFVGCGVGDVGRFIFPNHIQVLPASDFYSAVGVRAGLEFPVAPPRLFLHTAVDLRAPIHPAQTTVRGASIFEAAGPGVGLGLGLRLELPP